MLERYLIRYFLAVIDSGTFTAAANQMHVTQPTLSAGIAKLEQMVGAKLLRRTAHRVELTPAGTQFAAHARRIEREFNLAQTALTHTDQPTPVRLGILNTISSRELAELAAILKQTAPTLLVEMVEGSATLLSQSLSRGRVDLTLSAVHGAAPADALQLREEAYVLALSADHVLAGEAALPGEALAGEAMIVRRNCEALPQTSRYFTRRGVRPWFAMRTHNDDRAMEMVAAGLGATVVPASYRHHKVTNPALIGFDLTRTLIITKGDSATPDAIAPVIDALHQQFGV